jgi:hypothetical protein
MMGAGVGNPWSRNPVAGSRRQRLAHPVTTKHPKSPRDPNQLAKLIVDLATGAATEEKPEPPTPAQEFARSGGLFV